MPAQRETLSEGTAMAEYACDRCHTRKACIPLRLVTPTDCSQIACSREQPTCQRCRTDDRECHYSRAGVIRRDRKRKSDALSEQRTTSSPSNDAAASSSLLSHLGPEIDSNRALVNLPRSSASALDTVSSSTSAIWVDVPASMSAAKTQVHKYHTFKERAVEFADNFIATMKKGQPIFALPPEHVVTLLKRARPDLIEERAWLVMFYSITIAWTTSTAPDDSDTRQMLRSNLWLAFNDTRLLLEPSDDNVQALVLLAAHVEEFTTPSLCYMLTTTACRMLQALGIDYRRLNAAGRERRHMLFWQAELLDKGLAMIFARPPTNGRGIAKHMPIPTVGQLKAFRPHVKSASTPSMFGAHFLHHMILLSQLMGDIWGTLYDDEHNEEKVLARLGEAEAWYHRASKAVSSAAETEAPFLDDEERKSCAIGMKMVSSQYHYMVVLCCRRLEGSKGRRLDAAVSMQLHANELGSDSQEVYNGMIWHLICSAVTAFLVCLKELLTFEYSTSSMHTADQRTTHRSVLLQAMDCVPPFLAKLASSNALAAKLEPAVIILLEHGRGVSGKRIGRDVEQVKEEATQASWLASLTADQTWQTVMPEVSTELDVWSDQLFGEALAEWLPM